MLLCPNNNMSGLCLCAISFQTWPFCLSKMLVDLKHVYLQEVEKRLGNSGEVVYVLSVIS